jgi:hypothetical protein
MNRNDAETGRILAKQLRKRKLSILLFFGIMCSCFILANVAVTWVVRVERPPEGMKGKLFLVEIVDGNYVFVWGHTPSFENIYVSLNDSNRLFVRFLDEPVVGRSYDVYHCYNFFGGVVGLALAYSD